MARCVHHLPIVLLRMPDMKRLAFALALVVPCVASAATVQVIEYYNSSQDHYFVSSLAHV